MRRSLLALSLCLLLLPIAIKADGTPFERLLSVGSAAPGELAWSPDGSTLAVGTSAGIQLYREGAPAQTIDGSVDVAFNGSGNLIISRGQIWDVKTGKSLAHIGKTQSGFHNFSADHKRLFMPVVERGENHIAIWDISSAAAVRQITSLGYPADTIFTNAVLSPDLSRIVLEFSEQYVNDDTYQPPWAELWDIAQGKRIAKLEHQYGSFHDAAFSADGKWLYTYTVDGGYEVPYLWNGETGKLVANWKDRYAPQFSPDNRFLVMIERFGGGDIWVWDLQKASEIPLSSQKDGNNFTQVQFTPLGQYIIGLTQNAAYYWWTIPELSAKYETSDSSSDNLIALSPLSEKLIFQDRSGNLYLRKMRHSAEKRLEQGWNFGTFSPDGAHILLSNQQDSTFLMVNADTGEKEQVFPRMPALNADWTRAANWQDGNVEVTDVTTHQVTSYPALPDYIGTVLAVSENGQQAAFTAPDGHVQGYNLNTGKPSFTLAAQDEQTSLQFSPDGQRLLTIPQPNDNNQDRLSLVRLWDVSHDGPARLMLEVNALASASFSPDSQLLILSIIETGSTRTTIISQIWDTQTGGLKLSWENDDFAVGASIFNRENTRLAMVSFNGVRVLDLARMFQNGEKTGKRVETIEAKTFDNEMMLFTPQFGRFSDDSQQLFLSGFISPYEGDSGPSDFLMMWRYLIEDEPGFALFGHTGQMSPDGKYVLLKGGEGLSLHELKTKRVTILPLNAYSPVFSADSMQLAAMSDDGVRVFDLALNTLAQFGGDRFSSGKLLFLPDGKLLRQGNYSVEIWARQ